MNKRVVVAAVSAFLGAGGGALGQSHPYGVQSGKVQSHGRRLTPLTPAQQARRDQIDRLDCAAAAALNVGEYAEAEADARQSLALGIESGRGQELLAAALYAQGKDQEALQVYKAIADMGANASRNEFPYALLLLKSGQWARAVDAYDTALTLGGNVDLLRENTDFSPGIPRPRELEAAIRIGLGVTCPDIADPVSKRPHDMGMGNLRKALALAPDSPLAHFYYGFALKRLGHRAEAKAAFDKAAQLGGDDVKAAVKRFSR